MRLHIMGFWIIAATCGGAVAGTLNAEGWRPSNCGAEPVQPAYDLSTTSAFQASALAASAYKEVATRYVNCVIAEANADSAAISKIASDKKQALNEFQEKFTADAEAARTRLIEGVRDTYLK